MFVGLGTAAYVAIDDPSFALEPNYYDKAVHWDETQLQARQSSALGLKLAVAAPLSLAADGRVDVQLRVTDQLEGAFSGAQISLEAFPNAYASRVQHVSLHESTPGVYSGHLARGVAGLWELRVVVKRGALRYGEVLRCDVVKGGAA